MKDYYKNSKFRYSNCYATHTKTFIYLGSDSTKASSQLVAEKIADNLLHGNYTKLRLIFNQNLRFDCHFETPFPTRFS